ncbi:MAG: NAD-dependent epimerase/dehydratase family protein [Alphaproteobacteria bacterium]|nr:NAD-dependent epimerase/dehydratase family protein [Alphaproteobacteria bacterium]
MRIFMTGGTGLIGRAVLAELTARHEVSALARSGTAAVRLRALGAAPVRGDLRTPSHWLADLGPVDAVVHCAAVFEAGNMAAAEARFLAALRRTLALGPTRLRVVYTGGVWLYGAGAERVQDETAPFDPLPPFAYMADQIAALRADPMIDLRVVHPGLVFDSAGGGALQDMIADLEAGRPVRVTGDPAVRWPLVHVEDLADLYRRALEWEAPGLVVNGVAAEGVEVAAIARALARNCGLPPPGFAVRPVAQAVAEDGPIAAGYARSQRISGARARSLLGWRPAHAAPGAEADASAKRLGAGRRLCNPIA